MIMERNRSARTIKVSKEKMAMLAKVFNCTERMVYKALCFECDTLLAQRIRHVALKEMGGVLMAYRPEEEVFYEMDSDGERWMRQVFGNGALLEVSLRTGSGVVRFKDEVVGEYERVLVSEIPGIQNFARSLR